MPVPRAPLALLLAAAALAPGRAGADAVATSRSVALARAAHDPIPSRGPADALVTVELFCNFAHVQCAAAERTLRRVAERHPDGLRVLYRQVVLPFRDSQIVAAAAIEAFRQGRFLALADAAAALPAPLRSRDLEPVALRAGLDLEALRSALADQRHDEHLERDALRRESLGVGTIGLAWNGEVTAATDLSLEGALVSYRRAHARAVERLASGVPRAELFEVLSREASAARGPRARADRLDAGAPRVGVAIGASPVRGDPRAPVTVVVWNDFECSFCRRQAEVLRKLLSLYPRDVRLVYKHFPLAPVGQARAAADAVECARLQGRFWELHDLLLEGPLRRRARDLEQAKLAAGLDLERMRADLPSCQARVDADVTAGKAAGVESTPTLFVNGLRLTGLRGLAELRLRVEEELAPGLLGRLAMP